MPPAPTFSFQDIASAMHRMTGDRFFEEFVRTCAGLMGMRYAMVTECVEPQNRTVRTIAFWTGDGFADPVAFCVDGTPCASVVRGDETMIIPDGLLERFPEDEYLVRLGVRSYFGMPLRGSTGHTIGHVALLDQAATRFDETRIAIVNVLTNRAAAELERVQAETAVVEAAAREQRELARELHRGLGQELTGISLALAGMNQLHGSASEELSRDLDSLVDTSNNAVRLARLLSRMLSSDYVEANLAATLGKLVDMAGELYEVECELTHTGVATAPSRAVQSNVAAVVHEAISNAVRHGWARRIAVGLSCEPETTRIAITHDGGAPEAGDPGRHALFLSPTMRYRARELRGSITLGHENDSWRLLFELPTADLADQRKRHA